MFFIVFFFVQWGLSVAIPGFSLFLYSWLLREDRLLCSFGLMWKGYVSIGVRPANTWDFPQNGLPSSFRLASTSSLSKPCSYCSRIIHARTFFRSTCLPFKGLGVLQRPRVFLTMVNIILRIALIWFLLSKMLASLSFPVLPSFVRFIIVCHPSSGTGFGFKFEHGIVACIVAKHQGQAFGALSSLLSSRLQSGNNLRNYVTSFTWLLLGIVGAQVTTEALCLLQTSSIERRTFPALFFC